MRNRVYRKVEDFSDPQNPAIVGEQKFLVDINSQLPVVLCVVDAVSPNLLTSSYVYADAQVLCQRHHDPVDPNFYDASYYAHDRLGSVRLVVRYDDGTQTVRAANSTTYTPFGQLYEGQWGETIANPWKFTGQWHDAEIDQYHLRARQYDPTMMRFTSRDPVRGEQNEPLTLHKYLYCLNTPINRVDPTGEISATSLASAVITGYSLYGHGVSLAAYSVETGDERFWQLAELTFNFIPVAITVASFNPYGPATNLATFAAVRLNQMAYGSTTGMSTVQGLAVDPLAFLLYRGVMGTAQKYIGTDANDMQNFMSWMGVDWLDR